MEGGGRFVSTYITVSFPLTKNSTEPYHEDVANRGSKPPATNRGTHRRTLCVSCCLKKFYITSIVSILRVSETTSTLFRPR